MQRALELRLGGPVNAKAILHLLQRAYEEENIPLTEEQEDAFRALMVNASVGRAYHAHFHGKEAGYCLVSFYHHVRKGGRAAFVAEFYLVPEMRGKGLARRFLRGVLQDLDAFGILSVSAFLCKDSPLKAVYSGEGFACTSCCHLERDFLDDTGL